jgi:NADH:ubiquinone oxidoreductase subunit F (NADH-binding)
MDHSETCIDVRKMPWGLPVNVSLQMLLGSAGLHTQYKLLVDVSGCCDNIQMLNDTLGLIDVYVVLMNDVLFSQSWDVMTFCQSQSCTWFWQT